MFDWRGHDLQLEVARLAAELHEREGRVLVALKMLEGVVLSASGEPNGRAAARLATNLLRRVFTDPDRPPAPKELSAFWRYQGFVPPGPDGADIRLAFARALVAHDLPGPAVDVLQELASEAPAAVGAEATMLLASAHLLLGQPESALELLRSQAGDLVEPRPERNLLAAHALAGLGRFAEAAGLLYGSPSGEARAFIADCMWDAGLWSEAVPAHLNLLERARAAGDLETTHRAAIRAAAAAYMTGGAAALGADGKTSLASTSDVGQAAVTAFLSRPPAEGGLRARAAALIEQAAALAELAKTPRPQE